MRRLALAAAFAIMSNAAEYRAERLTLDGLEVLRLTDVAHKTEVSIAPALGNNSYEMKVNGRNIFWSPYKTLAEFKAKPAHLGNPFLAPWANRLSDHSFWANGKKFALDRELGNYRSDANSKPIHGLVVYSPHWKVTDVKADGESASATSRLEFFRHPEYMAQFPFSHSIEMTYRLSDGVLEVETRIENHSNETMPVSVGYHPYFTLSGVPRDQWSVRIPAREHWEVTKELVPTGKREPVAVPPEQRLEGMHIDDGYTALVRGESGRAEFAVSGASQRISVLFGPKYPVAIVYAPKGRDFVCFEPMTGPTNAFNLHHDGLYGELQTIGPGGEWKESFWIQPTGF